MINALKAPKDVQTKKKSINLSLERLSSSEMSVSDNSSYEEPLSIENTKFVEEYSLGSVPSGYLK